MSRSADDAYIAHFNVEAVFSKGRASRYAYFSVPITDILGFYLLGGAVLDEYAYFNGAKPVVGELLLPDNVSESARGLYWKIRSNGKVVRGKSLKCLCATHLSLAEVELAHNAYLRQTGTTSFPIDLVYNTMLTISHHEAAKPRLVWWLEKR